MNLADIKARIKRLDQLFIGIAKDIVTWEECNDPLLYVERREYLKAIQVALSGFESARVALVKGKQRLEEPPMGS